MAFFASRPPENALLYKFTQIHAEPQYSHPGRNEPAYTRLTWLTTWDARCKIDYWPEESDGRVVIDEGSRWTNHRVVLTELQPDTTYYYQLRAVAPGGAVIESDSQTFVTLSRPAGLGSATANRVHMTIQGTTDTPDRSVPVTHGLPFPKGVLGTSEHLRLVDADGNEIPLQTRSLTHWLDGNVKWVLLDFQAKSGRGYTLEYGSEIWRKQLETSLSIHEDENAVTILRMARSYAFSQV